MKLTAGSKARFAAVIVTAIVSVMWAARPSAQQRSTSVLAAADYYEIVDLNARFNHGLDSGADNGRMFASVFTSDGAFIDGAGHVTQGASALAAMAQAT